MILVLVLTIWSKIESNGIIASAIAIIYIFELIVFGYTYWKLMKLMSQKHRLEYETNSFQNKFYAAVTIIGIIVGFIHWVTYLNLAFDARNAFLLNQITLESNYEACNSGSALEILKYFYITWLFIDNIF